MTVLCAFYKYFVDFREQSIFFSIYGIFFRYLDSKLIEKNNLELLRNSHRQFCKYYMYDICKYIANSISFLIIFIVDDKHNNRR